MKPHYSGARQYRRVQKIGPGGFYCACCVHKPTAKREGHRAMRRDAAREIEEQLTEE